MPTQERGRLLTQLALLSGLRGVSNELRMELKAMGSGYVDVESNPILMDWMEEASEKARRKEAAKLLRIWLESRFGSLPAWAEERLNVAGTDELESWVHRTLTATSLPDVLGQE